jgi:hypothetical protein
LYWIIIVIIDEVVPKPANFTQFFVQLMIPCAICDMRLPIGGHCGVI